MSAKDRKRAALSGLRDLASEVGVPVSRRKADISSSDFEALHAQVVAACATEDQKRRAEDARSTYRSVPLPPVPGAQGAAGGPAPQAGEQRAADGADDEQAGFRLRSSSCLFTWNNRAFANCDFPTLWSAFLVWLNGLTFVIEWTATLERSLKSKDANRVHLHAFVEFEKAPDQTSRGNAFPERPAQRVSHES